MSLGTRIATYLDEQRITHSDGPPMAQFYSPCGTKLAYVTLDGRDLASEDHAERLCIAGLARIIAQHKGHAHVFWRVRPNTECDEFGLWGFFSRFVIVDPSEFSCAVPALQGGGK